MRLLPTNRLTRALTFTEVLFLVVVLLVLTALVLTFAIKWQARARLTQCQSNLRDVGMAFKYWSVDNDDRFPFFVTNCPAYNNQTQAWLHFWVMSNALGSARLLTCPQDVARATNAARGFSNGSDGLLSKTNEAVSYFVGLDADERFFNTLLSGDRNLLASPDATNPWVIPVVTNTPLRWGSDLHTNRGNVLLADGSVQNMDRWELQRHLARGTGVDTNRLLLPLVP